MLLARGKFLALLFLIASSQLSVGSNWFLSQLTKIFRGAWSTVDEHPYIVNLRRAGHFKCGGSLITPTCVLTAAHCLQSNPNADDLSVYGNQNCHSNEPVVRKVAYFRLPHQFNESVNLDMDIAILKLAEAFDTEEGGVQPVGIDYGHLHEGHNLTIAGWGDTGQFVPERCLKAAQVNAVRFSVCQRKFGHMNPVTRNMFCAIGVNSTDACSGDSGGPILRDGMLVGVVSWGVGCGRGFPGVYTRLGSKAVSLFVKQTIQRHCIH